MSMMRLTAGLMLLTLLGGGAVRADDSIDLMDALGSGYELERGGLRVDLYADSKVWINGVRWPTHDDGASARLMPGDVVITASPEKWYDPGKPTLFPAGEIYRYRLDYLDAKQATFTLTTYDKMVTRIGPTSRQFSVGRQRFKSTFVVDVSQGHSLFGLDYGPNPVELGSGVPSRSKPLR
jgi:hypothetical protein